MALINNNTNDTLKMVIGVMNTNINHYDPTLTYTLFPKDTLGYNDGHHINGIQIMEGMDPALAWLKGADWDTVLVFRHDTLKALWSFPVFTGPCIEHSFFNSQSWRTWLKDEFNNGYVMFTVYPSDLTLNGH